MNSFYFQNGQADIQIHPSNRALAYGDGLFETMRFVDGEIPLWSLHKERLLSSALRLKIDVDEPLLDNELNHVLAQLPALDTAQVIKLTLIRGGTRRGYRVDSSEKPITLWQVSQAPPRNDRGLKVGLCETRLAHQPLLAGIKHLNRLEQVLAGLEWQNEWDESLMLDCEDNLICAVAANVFVLKGNQVITPLLDQCGVSGVMRNYLMTSVFPHFKLDVIENRLNLDDVRSADALWLCNSVRGISEAHKWQECTFPATDLFQQIRERLSTALHPKWTH